MLSLNDSFVHVFTETMIDSFPHLGYDECQTCI